MYTTFYPLYHMYATLLLNYPLYHIVHIPSSQLPNVYRSYLLDYDKVDSHNLNRQLLYGAQHVHQQKVGSAMETLEHHRVRGKDTELVAMDMNALSSWSEIVKASADCNVVFDMIDVGEYWDLAVQSLCLARKCHYVSGGTFQSTVTVDYCPHRAQAPCWGCCADGFDESVAQQLDPSRILGYESIDFIPRNVNPIGASNAMVASLCANLMVNAWVQDLMTQQAPKDFQAQVGPVPNRFIFYMSTFESVKWPIEQSPNCPLVCSLHLPSTTTTVLPAE